MIEKKNVRTFCGSLIAALKYIIDRSYQLFGLLDRTAVHLRRQKKKTFVIQSVIKKHVHQPLGTIRIMKERGIKPILLRGMGSDHGP